MKALKETKSNKVQATIWIKFRKGDEIIKLPFNSRMMEVWSSSNLSEIVDEMLSHILSQIENPALANSDFEFEEVVSMDIDFHQLNLIN